MTKQLIADIEKGCGKLIEISKRYRDVMNIDEELDCGDLPNNELELCDNCKATLKGIYLGAISQLKIEMKNIGFTLNNSESNSKVYDKSYERLHQITSEIKQYEDKLKELE